MHRYLHTSSVLIEASAAAPGDTINQGEHHMSFCDDCPFEEKLLLCCPRFPETGELAVLVVNGVRMSACPHLDERGRCGIYYERPRGCRDFECDRLRNGESASGFMRFF